MPRIVKFLESQYNLNGDGETIRVGTLQHYRSLPEEEGIGDYLEGIAGFNTVEDTTLTPETAKHMMPGLKKGEVTIGKGGGLFKMTSNCYIFCATYIDEWDVDETIFPQYDSFYTIKDCPQFAAFIQSLLIRSFSLDDVEEYCLQRLNKVPASNIRIGLDVKWSRVSYSREKALEISNSNVEELMDFQPTDYLQIFCKPKKYANQSEFRIVFRPFCHGFGFISVKPPPKDLSLSLKSEVLKCISD
jgi:hypothetical protein